MSLQIFRTFLDRCKVGKGEFHNWVSLKGGRFHITAEDHSEFLEKHIAAIQYYSEDNAPSLAWRSPEHTHFPLIFDVDIELNEEHQFSNQQFINLAKMFMLHITWIIKNEGLGVVLTRKEKCYRKTKNNKIIYKTGFHMFVFHWIDPFFG